MTVIEYDSFFIDGAWRRPSGGETLDVISPTSEELVGRAPAGSAADIEVSVAAARKAFDQGPWPRMSYDERRAIVARAGELLAEQADQIGDLITNENGTLRKFGYRGPIPDFAYNCSLELPAPIDRTSSFSGAEARIFREPI